MSRYLALTCEALARSVYAAAATSPHTITVQLFRQGLHDTPNKLRATLQAQIDDVPADQYDAILLVYGMCGTSTVGLVARHTPLVMARTHDCIALYLGSHARYQAEFDAQPGTYWYSRDYMERAEPGSSSSLGATGLVDMNEVYADYVEKYGQDNADYLMEVMGEWSKHYSRAVYIDMGDGGEKFEQVAREDAQRRGWQFERKTGDRRMLTMLVHGQWPEDEYLVIPPGHRLEQYGGEGLIQAVPVDGESAAEGEA